MISIDDTHVRRLDLTLLIVFDALLQSGKMSTVGRDLGMTQSAVSHAVGRLRRIFDDPLFVRKGAGVVPTARARQLGGPIGEALAAVRGAVRLGRGFDLATTGRNFSVAALDSVIGAIAPPLIRAIGETAPRCRVLFRTLGRTETEAGVLAGTIDVAVGVFPAPPDPLTTTAVVHEDYLVTARRDHPRIGATLDLDTYCGLHHILVSPSGDARGSVDGVLERLGRQRRVIGVVPQFVSAFMVVATSDAVVTAPSKVALKLARAFGLATHPLPMPVPGFELAILRHRASLSDPAIDWLVGRIEDALRSGATLPATMPGTGSPEALPAPGAFPAPGALPAPPDP